MFSNFAKLLKCSVIIRTFHVVINEMTQITSSSNNSSRAGKNGSGGARAVSVVVDQSLCSYKGVEA